MQILKEIILERIETYNLTDWQKEYLRDRISKTKYNEGYTDTDKGTDDN